MKKQLKLGGNEVEITISAQSYLNDLVGFSEVYSPTKIYNLLNERQFALSVTFNRFPLFTVPNVNRVDLFPYLETIETIAQSYLEKAAQPSSIEDAVIENQLTERGFKS